MIHIILFLLTLSSVPGSAEDISSEFGHPLENWWLLVLFGSIMLIGIASILVCCCTGRTRDDRVDAPVMFINPLYDETTVIGF